MLVKEIIKKIEERAPLSFAYDWDNSGFLCGDPEMDAKKIYLTLDTNMYTVNEAAKMGADMIISHHPIMFGGINKIDFSKPSGAVIKTLIKNDIALYAAHTSMDTAKDGLNDMLAKKLGIIETEVIDGEGYPEGCGLGRIGDIDTAADLKSFAGYVKKALSTPFVRISGDTDTLIKRVAVGSGACSELIPAAVKMGADVMVTADMKYHDAIDGVENGIAVIDAGHYPTENFVTGIFADILSCTGCEIIYSSEKDIFSFL